MEVLKKFSVNNIYLYENDDDPDFAIAEFWFLSNKNNSHNNPIDIEVLKRCSPTCLGKFIVAQFEDCIKDTLSHTDNQVIMGYIDPNQSVDFRDKDGKTFAVVNGKISKLYATDVVEMFRKHNHRWVSVEMTCDEGEENVYGEKPIIDFTIHGITILGLDYKPSCRGAEMKIIKFSESQNHSDLDELKLLSEQISKTYKVDKSAESMVDSEWGTVDKISLRNKIMTASNRKSLVESVYMEVENGWEDAPSEKLKYPVMQFKGDILVYNRNGLSSALGYAKAENNTDVVNKVEAIYSKLGLNKEKDMAKKTFEIEGREAWGDVIKQVEDHEGKGVYVDSIEKDHILFTKDGVKYRVEADVEVGKDDKTVKATIKWDTKKESADQKQMSDKKDKDGKSDDKSFEDKNADKDCDDDDDDDDDEGDSDDKSKQFSYDANLDMAAINEMLKEETEDYRKLVNETLSKRDMNIIMADYLAMAKERDILKKYKEEKEAEEVKASVDACLAEAKCDLSEEKFDELSKMGEATTKETLAQFSNTVKAFAYDCSKNKEHKDDDHISYKAFSELESKTKTLDDVYKKFIEE